MTTSTWAKQWARRIKAAQVQTTVELGGQTFNRVPYGAESGGAHNPQCRDCGCGPGQFHVELCCIEQCPRCGGQWLGCECRYHGSTH